jgi:uncharacterized BrkB/YihY/UPF0761 family membrane protein
LLRTDPALAERYGQGLTALLGDLLPTSIDEAAWIARSVDAFLTAAPRTILVPGPWATVATVAVLAWAATGFFASLQRALEIIFDVPRARGFFRNRGVALLLLLSVAAVVGIEGIGSALATWAWSTLAAAPRDLESFGLALPPPPDWLSDRGPLRWLLSVVVFTACFRWLPRRTSRWDAAAIGAIVSVVGLQAMRRLLPLAVDEAAFNVVYGVVASLVVLLLWTYLTLATFLAGAIVAAEVASRREHAPADDDRRVA